jgi:hypothetical protein
MLSRHSDSHRSAHAGVIVACVSCVAFAALVIAGGRGADDVPARPSPVVAKEAEARQRAIEDAAGSDRHLEILAAELAGRAEARRQAIEDAAGSDRHLEILAAELASKARSSEGVEATAPRGR